MSNPMSNQFTQFPDLASRALGGNVCTANDELFAQRENLIRPTARQPSIPHSPPCTTVTAIADAVKAVAQAERTNNA